MWPQLVCCQGHGEETKKEVIPIRAIPQYPLVQTSVSCSCFSSCLIFRVLGLAEGFWELSGQPSGVGLWLNQRVHLLPMRSSTSLMMFS